MSLTDSLTFLFMSVPNFKTLATLWTAEYRNNPRLENWSLNVRSPKWSLVNFIRFLPFKCWGRGWKCTNIFISPQRPSSWVWSVQLREMKVTQSYHFYLLKFSHEHFQKCTFYIEINASFAITFVTHCHLECVGQVTVLLKLVFQIKWILGKNLLKY